MVEKLRGGGDLWVATADGNGRAHLVPFSYYWDGRALILSTPQASRTVRNLIRARWARVALGPTRDVVIIEGAVEVVAMGADAALEDGFARATGFDPRRLMESYVYLRLTPREIQAWREANELRDRDIMRQGEWLE